MKWFKMLPPDENPPTHWYLESPYDSQGQEIDPRYFTEGVRSDIDQEMHVKVHYYGKTLLFNFGAFLMPVVHRTVVDLIAQVAAADFQRFSVTIDGESGEYEILNVIHVRKCVDEARTKHVMKWTKDDMRPDLAGQYQMLYGVRVDAEALVGVNLARVWGHEVILLCSETIRDLLESHEVSGVRYVDVN